MGLMLVLLEGKIVLVLLEGLHPCKGWIFLLSWPKCLWRHKEHIQLNIWLEMANAFAAATIANLAYLAQAGA